MPTFTNQATLSYNGSVLSSNVATGELVETLSITKTAVGDTYDPSGKVTYVISLVNTGTTAQTGVTVTDNLGSYTLGSQSYVPETYAAGTVAYYQNGVLQTAPTVVAGPPLVISGITVPAGGNVTLAYEAEINQYAPLGEGRSIVNTATLGGAGITAATATETVTPATNAQLSINKSVSPTTVSENGTLTYTFVIQNSGAGAVTAADNLIINDTFDPILSNLTVSLNGTPLALNTGYTYSQSTGAFATVAGAVTVPAATYSQNQTTGVWTTTPGVTTLTVTGTV